MREFKRNDKPRRDGPRDFARGRDKSRGSSRGRSFDKPRFNSRDSRDSGDRPPLEMHEVVCANCGKDTEVPFKPTSTKPVYCLDCFRKMEGTGGRERRSDRGERGNDNSSRALEDINRKLDKIMRALEIE